MLEYETHEARGGVGMDWDGVRVRQAILFHCEQQNDSFCIKMGSALSRFPVSLTGGGGDKSHKTMTMNHQFWSERWAETDLNPGLSAAA